MIAVINLAGYVARLPVTSSTGSSMSTRDIILFNAVIFLFLIGMGIIIYVSWKKSKPMSPPDWWHREWDFEEPAWPHRPRGGSDLPRPQISQERELVSTAGDRYGTDGAKID